MRRWKMMFDRHGDVLRCEQIDGPSCTNGLELIVVQERTIPRKPDGGGSNGNSPAGKPDPDALSQPSRYQVTEADSLERPREPVAA